MHIHLNGYFDGKGLVPYHSKIHSENMHISATLDLVADKIKQSVSNLYHRFIFTGSLMILLCCYSVIIISFISSLFKWPHIGVVCILSILDFWFVRLQVCLHFSVYYIVSCSDLVTSGFLTRSCNNYW